MFRFRKWDHEDVADGTLYPGPELKDRYRRYEISESGISPRALPGMEGFKFTVTGLEHTEKGTPDYTSGMHTRMSEKRHRKIHGALQDLSLPVEYLAGDKMDIGVISWGSTTGSALEAVKKSQKTPVYRQAP